MRIGAMILRSLFQSYICVKTAASSNRKLAKQILPSDHSYRPSQRVLFEVHYSLNRPISKGMLVKCGFSCMLTLDSQLARHTFEILLWTLELR